MATHRIPLQPIIINQRPVLEVYVAVSDQRGEHHAVDEFAESVDAGLDPVATAAWKGST